MDSAKLMVTMGIKEVFRYLEQNKSKLLNLQKYNELLRGYLHEVLGLLDPKNLKDTLGVTLNRRDKENV